MTSRGLSTAPGRERSWFGADRLELIAELEGSHFWFAGRRALVERMLDRHLGRRVACALDVGCGTGAFLETLARYADDVFGVDPLAARDDGRVRTGHAAQLPFPAESIDLATALDVLEHVDDAAVLVELRRVLRPGGLVVATVPAFPFLWSKRDELAAHRRRYRRTGLVRQFEAAGFEVVETAYYQFALFPLVVASRLVAGTSSAEDRPPPKLNRMLRRLNELEVRLGRRARWPWGSTLALAARKVEG